MKKKQKHILTAEHINRLLIIAECLENKKLHEDFPKPFLFKEDLPYQIVDYKVIFSSFPFTYTELPRLFPEH